MLTLEETAAVAALNTSIVSMPRKMYAGPQTAILSKSNNYHNVMSQWMPNKNLGLCFIIAEQALARVHGSLC